MHVSERERERARDSNDVQHTCVSLSSLILGVEGMCVCVSAFTLSSLILGVEGMCVCVITSFVET